MKVLALDLGTDTGWALWDDGKVSSGAWKLMTPEEVKKMHAGGLDRCCDPRFSRLGKHLLEFGKLDYVFFEDVQFLSSQLQAQLWAGLRTIVIILCPSSKVVAVPVGTLKKFATGKGNADKAQMQVALAQKYPLRFELQGTVDKPFLTKSGGRVEVGDDEADAFHLLVLALDKLKLPVE